ncbi:flavoprotein [Nocardia sp. CA-135398]|uniref:flavoprotein n=1 Tax=Nocardia sp. CA-135398 TaxID=3239977 RepID=UPI003D95EAF6
MDAAALAAKTGHTVRSQYKEPGAPDVLRPADATLAAPITANSLAKWAAGISDTLVLGLLVEAVGKGLPVVAVPFSNRAHLGFPAIQDAIGKLTEWGVTMLTNQPHEPENDANQIPLFPWESARQALLDHPRNSLTR